MFGRLISESSCVNLQIDMAVESMCSVSIANPFSVSFIVSFHGV